MKILIFGASGMLGHTLYLELKKFHDVVGICRSRKWHDQLISGVDISDVTQVEKLINEHNPDFILNAIGMIKQLDQSKNKLLSIEINSHWPHKLCQIAKDFNAKVIHFSTDCVFSGVKGSYSELDHTDSRDTYGLTKLLGEVDYDHSLTLRTSIIGHEIETNINLIEWFLSREKECNGFQKAIYSGFPTITLARFLNNYVFSNWFSGLYHLSSAPISKFELLNLVSEIYKKQINIIPVDNPIIDRSLKSEKLKSLTGYISPSWTQLITEMHQFYLENQRLYKDKK